MTRIALIGYRGCGKSTVGPLLAAKLGWRFIDVDVLIEANAGMSIAQIFKVQGESAFRDLEHTTIARLEEEQQIVLATGGGAILRAAVRQHLIQTTFAVWLDASPETCWKRIQADPATAARRPNLTASGGFEEVVRVLEARRGFYEATAHLRVEADQSPELIADAILQAWHSRATA